MYENEQYFDWRWEGPPCADAEPDWETTQDYRDSERRGREMEAAAAALAAEEQRRQAEAEEQRQQAEAEQKRLEEQDRKRRIEAGRAAIEQQRKKQREEEEAARQREQDFLREQEENVRWAQEGERVRRVVQGLDRVASELESRLELMKSMAYRRELASGIGGVVQGMMPIAVEDTTAAAQSSAEPTAEITPTPTVEQPRTNVFQSALAAQSDSKPSWFDKCAMM